MSKSQPERKDPSQSEPGPLQDGQWSEPQLRFMKRAIAVMSTVLILGFMLLIWRIMNLTTGAEPDQPAKSAAATAASDQLLAQTMRPLTFKAQAELVLPPGARAQRFSLSGQFIAVQYTSTDGQGIAVVDLTTGKTVSTLRITNKSR